MYVQYITHCTLARERVKLHKSLNKYSEGLHGIECLVKWILQHYIDTIVLIKPIYSDKYQIH